MIAPPPTEENGHPLCLDHARWWRDLGFRPVRVRVPGERYRTQGADPSTGGVAEVVAAGKEASEPGWQTSDPSAADLDRLFRRRSKVGCLTGPKTGNGYGVVDLDCVEAMRAASLLPPPAQNRAGAPAFNTYPFLSALASNGRTGGDK